MQFDVRGLAVQKAHHTCFPKFNRRLTSNHAVLWQAQAVTSIVLVQVCDLGVDFSDLLHTERCRLAHACQGRQAVARLEGVHGAAAACQHSSACREPHPVRQDNSQHSVYTSAVTCSFVAITTSRNLMVSGR